MVKGFAFSLGLLLLPALAHSNDRIGSIKSLNKLAFGSCSKQYHVQPLWKEMITETPDLFIWGGDNIYADSTNPDFIKRAYDVQNEHPDYQVFKAMTPIIGTWDDHDFGYNNSAGNFSQKALSQAHFLNFMEEPAMSPRRHQEGIYTSYEVPSDGKKIKLILLDNRYFKNLDAKAPMLGEVQWQWLEDELKNSTASMHFIMAGLSILSYTLPFSEEWADFAQDYNRFINLMQKYRPKGLVLLTGDKHFSSIFQRHGMLEFMSSGMTHVLSKPLRPFVAGKYPNLYFGLNYGLIDIAWEESTPLITMAIRNTRNESIIKKSYRWSEGGWKDI